MSGIPYRASVPKLLPSTVRSCKRGNRAQANASSSSRSAFVHANPASHLVHAERGLMTGHLPPGRSPWCRSSPRPCWRYSPRSPPGSTAGTSDRYRHRRARPRLRRRRGPAARPGPSAAPGAASDHRADRRVPAGYGSQPHRAAIPDPAARRTSPGSPSSPHTCSSPSAWSSAPRCCCAPRGLAPVLPATICELVLRDGDGCPFLRLVVLCSAVMADRRSGLVAWSAACRFYVRARR